VDVVIEVDVVVKEDVPPWSWGKTLRSGALEA
jgi:hypothetical protein